MLKWTGWKDSPDGKKELVKGEQAIVLATVWWRVVCHWEECTEIKLFQITSHNLLQKCSHPFTHKEVVSFMRYQFFLMVLMHLSKNLSCGILAGTIVVTITTDVVTARLWNSLWIHAEASGFWAMTTYKLLHPYGEISSFWLIGLLFQVFLSARLHYVL